MFGQFLAAGQDVVGGTFAALFEEIAQFFEKRLEFFYFTQANAVGGIGNDHVVFRFIDLPEIPAAHGYAETAGDLF
jgi:hypothetical protein